MHTLRQKLLLVPVIVLAAILVGCVSQSGAAQEAVETTQVEMPPSYRFDPAVIRVPVGMTVSWANRDNFTHNVHVLAAEGWSSPPLRAGESTSYTFTQPGEYPYQCDFHPQDMTGTVIVVAP